MSREELSTMYSDGRNHRVVIFRRQDGIYGFEEQVLERPHGVSWVRSGHDSASHFDSEGLATYECIARVGWLTEMLVTGRIPEGSGWRRVVGPPPSTLGRTRVICFSPIHERHRCTGRPFVNFCGRLAVIAGLAVCQAGPDSFFLFGCDSDWNPIWDTWHQTLEDARGAGEEEYQGISQTWERLAEPEVTPDRCGG
jgi:hypothetical protein